MSLRTPTERRMVLGTLILGAVVVGAYSLGAVNRRDAKDVVPWLTDYEKAVDRSRETGKLIYIRYTASWCPPCRRMDARVYSKPAIAKRITDQFVPLKQDVDTLSPREDRLVRRLGFYAIPTRVIMSAEGRQMSRYSGFAPKVKLLKWFDSLKNIDPQTKPTSPVNPNSD